MCLVWFATPSGPVWSRRIFNGSGGGSCYTYFRTVVGNKRFLKVRAVTRCKDFSARI